MTILNADLTPSLFTEDQQTFMTIDLRQAIKHLQKGYKQEITRK